jgi:hypothetical protein
MRMKPLRRTDGRSSLLPRASAACVTDPTLVRQTGRLALFYHPLA